MTTIDEKRFEEIMKALDLEALSPEEQEEILVDIQSLISRGSLVRLIERMDDATRDDFEKLLETDASEEDVEQFLTTRVPDADSAVMEAVQDLTDDILAVSNPNN